MHIQQSNVSIFNAVSQLYRAQQSKVLQEKAVVLLVSRRSFTSDSSVLILGLEYQAS